MKLRIYPEGFTYERKMFGVLIKIYEASYKKPCIQYHINHTIIWIQRIFMILSIK